MKKTGVLLVNLGTPDSPAVSDVRKYLTEFLNDPRVIDLPWLKRKLLVNGIIVPLRAPKSAKEYAHLWELSGGESPLLKHSINLTQKVHSLLKEKGPIDTMLAMRYGNPSIDSVLEEMRQNNYEKIIIVPLYPQYASASNGTAIEKILKIISKWWAIPEISVVGQFYDSPAYLDAFTKRGSKYPIEKYDHVLFSYHGLPERHVDKVYVKGELCKDHNCEQELDNENKLCYKAVCYATSRELSARLNIHKDKYSVSFQSRLGKDPWVEPYTEETIAQLAKNGTKKLLVFSPAFVADCLETVVEIQHTYAELFVEMGGEKLTLVESLNSEDYWANGLANLLDNYLHSQA